MWLWLNALEATAFIKQSKAQQFSPNFMVFPFNLTTQTLGDDALSPPITGFTGMGLDGVGWGTAVTHDKV